MAVKNKKKSSIRAQMIRIVSLVIIILTITIVSAGIISGYIGIESTVQQNLLTMTQFSDQLFSGAISDAENNVLKLVSEYNRTCALGIMNGLKFSDMLVTDSIFKETAFVGGDNGVFSNYEIFTNNGIDSCIDVIDIVRETNEPELTTTVSFGGELRFVVVAPAQNGIYLATLPIDYFSSLISDKTICETGNVFMIDQYGTMIANTRPWLVDEQQNFIKMAATGDSSYNSAADVYYRMTIGETGVDRYSYEGVKRIVAFGPVTDGNGWSYGVCAPEKEFLSSIFTIVTALLICSFICLILSIFVVSAFATKTTKPIKQMSKRMALLAQGDLYTPVSVADRNDEIGVLAYEFGETIASLKSYIRDIDEVLHEMASGNIQVKPSIKYDGDFVTIEKSLKKILTSFNQIFSEISASSNLVSEGAGRVSEASQNLADGAAEQTQVVAALIDTLDALAKTSAENSVTTRNAEKDSVKSGEQVKFCNERMQNAADAMAEITDSSLQIEKIISTIEDIAFQTNILALNAEIEAARAGQAGKGFAVVADEVRNLANKSDKAAKATKQLIENSLQSVNRGTEIVSEVSNQLNESTEIVLKAVEDMKTVNIAVRSEDENIRKISASVEQINSVVHANRTTSEQSAETSMRLSQQADKLNHLMSNFKFDE